MIRVLLFGARGRMGRITTEDVVADEGLTLAAGVESAAHPDVGKVIDGAPIIADEGRLPEADVWLDFSIAGAAMNHCRLAAELGKPLVQAATGFSAADLAQIKHYSASCPILLAPNLSAGMGVLEAAAELAGKMLKDSCDVGIVERHHRAKVDAPSGSAKRLAEILASGGLNAEIRSLRQGAVFGEHSVYFSGENEELVLIHRAFSRRAFSRGALRAVRFLFNKPAGLYTIADLLEAGR